MAYDERLADRVRKALGDVSDVTERRMFGGIAFMVRGNMCCGIIDDRLMVRVGADAYETALKLTHAGPMDFSGKAMRGFVIVSADGARTTRQVRTWIDRALDFVRTLPAK
jgi:TfoX/Sxy family transcriptional regulator of competence genes